MCYMTHIKDYSLNEEATSRCDRLAADQDSGPVASDSRFAEFPPQPVRVPELLGLFVRPAACELCAVWSAQRKEVCGLRSRESRPGGTAGGGERPCPTGPADGGWPALRQSVEARAGKRTET